MIDPLDAQNAGLHDAALEQGHEEIALNLEGFDQNPHPSRCRAAGEDRRSPKGLAAADAVGSRVRGAPFARSTTPSRLRSSAPRRRRGRARSLRARLRQERRVSARSVCDDRRCGVVSTRKIAGVSFEGRQDVIAGLARRSARSSSCGSPHNQHDRNAIAVCYGNLQLGFVTTRVAAHLAPLIDAGARYRARVAIAHRRPGSDAKHRGVNIFVERDAVASRRASAAQARARHCDSARTATARARPGGADRRVAAARSAARRARTRRARAATRSRSLEPAAESRSAFSTRRRCARFADAGRRWSSIRCARSPTINTRRCGAASIRSDCASFAPTARSQRRSAKTSSRRCAKARGTSCSRRRSSSSSIARRSRSAARPSFVVVDEAHHLHESRHRPAYATLGSDDRGARQSAGAGAHRNRRRRGLRAHRRGAAHRCVGDRSDRAREPARRRRARNQGQDRRTCAASSTRRREKGIVYCNSRSESDEGRASDCASELGNEVMFYHAGMPTARAPRSRAPLSRRRVAGRRRDVRVRRGHRSARRAPRRALPPQLRLHGVQSAGRARRPRRSAGDGSICSTETRIAASTSISSISSAPTLPVLRAIFRRHEGARARRRRCAAAFGDLAGTLDLDKADERTVSAALRIFAESEPRRDWRRRRRPIRALSAGRREGGHGSATSAMPKAKRRARVSSVSPRSL